jgi:hypothetical protein
MSPVGCARIPLEPISTGRILCPSDSAVLRLVTQSSKSDRDWLKAAHSVGAPTPAHDSDSEQIAILLASLRERLHLEKLGGDGRVRRCILSHLEHVIPLDIHHHEFGSCAELTSTCRW